MILFADGGASKKPEKSLEDDLLHQLVEPHLPKKTVKPELEGTLKLAKKMMSANPVIKTEIEKPKKDYNPEEPKENGDHNENKYQR